MNERERHRYKHMGAPVAGVTLAVLTNGLQQEEQIGAHDVSLGNIKFAVF